MKKVYKIGEVETSNMKAVYNYASKNGITKIDDLLVKESKKKSKKKSNKIEMDATPEVLEMASMS